MMPVQVSMQMVQQSHPSHVMVKAPMPQSQSQQLSETKLPLESGNKESLLVIDGMKMKDCIQRCVLGEEILRVLERLPVTNLFDGQTCTFNRVIKLLKETQDLPDDFPLYSKISHIKKDTKLKELRTVIVNFHLKGPVSFDMLRKTVLGDRVKAAIKRPHQNITNAVMPHLSHMSKQGMPVGQAMMGHNGGNGPAPSDKNEFDKFVASEILKEKAKSEEANRLLTLMDSATFQSLPHDKRQRIELKYWSIIGL